MAVGVTERRDVRIALGVAGACVALLVLAQLFLPVLAAKRVSHSVARYGTVRSVTVSAFPAVELLWGTAGSVAVAAGTLTLAPAQIVALLWEARGVHTVTVTANAANLRVPALPHGLTVGEVRMEKHGSAVKASATLTQSQLDEALPGGFHVEPVAGGGGQVEVKASGGFFGVQTSIAALVKPLEGRLVAAPQGFPLAGLATVTIFSDPHLQVQSVGLRVTRTQPLTYALSLSAVLR